MVDKQRLFSLIPKVDELLKEEDLQDILHRVPRSIVVESIRESIEDIRKAITYLKEDEINDFTIGYDLLIKRIKENIEDKNSMKLRKVINATGVVLHTNLGRSLLSGSIKDEVWRVASSYSNLELDVASGKRGSRYTHTEDIIKKLTGAEAALVVNNNAAAVLLVLGTLGRSKEIIVSRGQLVEIGGSFRIPDVMEQSGAKLVEVGTTNKTHLWDYEGAINENTAALLKVHTSNYKILGFTKEVDLEDMVSLGKKFKLPIIEDIGSGTLIDFSKYGISKENTVQESIEAGVDIVTFSGDKLLGGPQAGIIVGKQKYIEKMKKNPITRALRVDKLTLAALEATLRLYLDEGKAILNIPTLRMLTMDLDEISHKADKLLLMLKNNTRNCKVEKVEGFSQVGGGSMPLEELKTYLVSIESYGISSNKLEERLRGFEIPIIARINNDKVLLDLRTVQDDEFQRIVDAFDKIL